MAILNGIYIFVEQEQWSDDVEVTEHPTESGVPTTSTARNRPLELSITGKFVNVQSMTAAVIANKVRKLKSDKSLINYSGRRGATNMMITGFSLDYNNKNSGGADFSMTLKQVRIAKSAYTKPKQTAAKKEQKKTAPVLKVGAKVVFKGGYVYVSSDAKKPAAKRGRSTCKIEKINTKSWSIHDYHLVSTDGKKVCGWCDKADIEGVASDSTAATTKSGTKQPTKGTSKAVYHTVKKGDTLYKLAHVTYKKYNLSTSTLMKNNPNAFSIKGNANTLKVGAKLLITKNG